MTHPYEAPPPLPAENGIHIWRTAIIVPFISFLFVAARFYTRLYLLGRRLMVDDYLVAVTMVLSIAHAVLMGIATYHGMGLHVWQFTPQLNASYYLWVGISSQFYTAALAGFKSALIFLYLQTIGLLSRKFRIICYLVLFYTVGYLTSNLFVQFLGCWPIAKAWRDDLPGHCINRTAANTFFGICHVTSDLVIAILPLGHIWNLTYPTTKQKIGLSFMLSSGFLAWAVATVRYVISTYDQFTYDRTWWAGIGFAFSILEVNTGLICTCVPTFAPLVSALNRVRIAQFITSWTTRAAGLWDEKDDLEYDRYMAVENVNTQESDEPLSWRRCSGEPHPVPEDIRETTTFSHIDSIKKTSCDV
ncbi:hypothetical protein GGS21DRAFT_404800 [Xylaria nigripes]|nr:hypothetical protein GGS21DRAFT_404800 [Xylaria nigripes]